MNKLQTHYTKTVKYQRRLEINVIYDSYMHNKHSVNTLGGHIVLCELVEQYVTVVHQIHL